MSATGLGSDLSAEVQSGPSGPSVAAGDSQCDDSAGRRLATSRPLREAGPRVLVRRAPSSGRTAPFHRPNMVRIKASSRPIAFVFALTVIAVVYVRGLGRVWWCACGQWYPVSLNVNSMHNSQHLLDAYSLSHVLHGILFFGLLWPLRGRINLGWRFAIAAAIEIGWEMMENSPIIIDRYRTATMALGYTGDSIVNTLGDIASFLVGFWIAKKVGLWWSVILFIVVELAMLWWMRDNLTLNVLMLLWPIDAIRQWQSGG